MMYWRLLLAVGIAMGFVAPAHSDEVFPLGVWTDARGRMVVRITPCDATGTTFCGSVVQDNRRGRPTNPPGHMVIRSLVPQRQHWVGQAHDGPLRLDFTLHSATDDSAKARLCLTAMICLNERVQRVATLARR